MRAITKSSRFPSSSSPLFGPRLSLNRKSVYSLKKYPREKEREREKKKKRKIRKDYSLIIFRVVRWIFATRHPDKNSIFDSTANCSSRCNRIISRNGLSRLCARVAPIFKLRYSLKIHTVFHSILNRESRGILKKGKEKKRIRLFETRCRTLVKLDPYRSINPEEAWPPENFCNKSVRGIEIPSFQLRAATLASVKNLWKDTYSYPGYRAYDYSTRNT